MPLVGGIEKQPFPLAGPSCADRSGRKGSVGVMGSLTSCRHPSVMMSLPIRNDIEANPALLVRA